MILETDRTSVEKWDHDTDIIWLQHHYSTELVLKYMQECRVTTSEQARDIITINNKNLLKEGFALCKIVDKSLNVVIGTAGCWSIPVDEHGNRLRDDENGVGEEIEIGYDLSPEYWGMGYATEVTVGWSKYMKDFTRKLVAFCEFENIPSHRVLIKAGFTQLEGKHFHMESDHTCQKFELIF
jgi:ribosomal-protein-alanine N-acetyltransferase